MPSSHGSLFDVSVSDANSLDLIIMMTSRQGINGHSKVLRKTTILSYLLSSRAVEDNPRVPASAGLSPSVHDIILQLSSVPGSDDRLFLK